MMNQIKIGEQVYNLGLLTIKELLKINDLTEELGTIKDQPFCVHHIKLMVEIIYLALGRHNPELTREQLEDSLNPLNVIPIHRTILEAEILGWSRSSDN